MSTRRRSSASSSTASRTVRVGITQMACGPDPDANLARQLVLAERAMKGGARIVCTQELFRSQYFCQVEDHRFFALAENLMATLHLPSSAFFGHCDFGKPACPGNTAYGWVQKLRNG